MLPNWLSIVLIITIGVTVYANSLNGEFIWDDLAFVQNNDFIKHWPNLPKIFTADATTSMDVGGGGVRYNLYRPLQWLTFMVDYSLWGLNKFGYHLTNVILHVSVALITFWLAGLFFGNRLLSLLTAIFFVIHPVHTEAVAYISGRADPLGLLFMLTSFVFYIKYIEKEKIFFCIISLACYILAILSRESCLILPVLLALYHFTFKKKFRPNLYFSFAGITVAYITFRLLMVRMLLAGRAIPAGTLADRLPGTFAAITNYVRLLAMPFHLHMEYGQPAFSMTAPKVIIGIAILIASLVYAFRKRKDKLIFFSILWFYITLLPSLNLYPVGAYMAEHWLYLPSIGFFLILAKLVSRLAGKRVGGFAAVSLTLIVFYSLLTIGQNNYWRKLIPFYETTLRYAPESARLYSNLGVAYNDSGRHRKALAAFEKAFEIEPKLLEVNYNIGTVYADTGELEKAIKYFEKEIAINPNYFKAYNNLGAVYSDTGSYEKAIEFYKKAAELESGRVEVLCNLAFAYFKIGDYDKAKREYRKAIEINTRFTKAYNDLAMVYHATGEYEEAITFYKKAMEVGRGHKNIADVYFNLGISYDVSNKRLDAIEAYKKALKFDPNHKAIHNNLAIAYFREGKFDLAISHCDRARELGYDINARFLADLEAYRK